MIAALIMATAATAGMKPLPINAEPLNLQMSPAAAAGQLAAQSGEHRRSRYLLPEADRPSEDSDGIQFRWKFKKIKMTMPIPSI
jgi:hypothetical protein